MLHLIIHVIWVYLSRLVTKPTMWLCAQRRLRSAWASAQSDQSLRCALNRKVRTQGFFMRTAETLIRLSGCPGWSESSLGAQSFCWFCHFSIYHCWWWYFIWHIKDSLLDLSIFLEWWYFIWHIEDSLLDLSIFLEWWYFIWHIKDSWLDLSIFLEWWYFIWHIKDSWLDLSIFLEWCCWDSHLWLYCWSKCILMPLVHHKITAEWGREVVQVFR